MNYINAKFIFLYKKFLIPMHQWTDKNKKDETKLELVKDIFQNDLNKKKIDDSSIIIPKDIVEILKSCLDTWGKIKGK